MAIQVLGRRPNRPEDVDAREILDRAPERIDAVYLAQLDHFDAALVGSYGIRLVVLAMREHSLGRLQDGLLAMALDAAVRNGDDRDIMIGLALPHVAAAQLGVQPALLFETVAARFEEGWLPVLQALSRIWTSRSIHEMRRSRMSWASRSVAQHVARDHPGRYPITFTGTRARTGVSAVESTGDQQGSMA